MGRSELKNFRITILFKYRVETAQGEEYGEVMIPNRIVEDDKIIEPLKKVVRIASYKDHKHYEECRKKEKEADEEIRGPEDTGFCRPEGGRFCGA